MNFTKLQRVLGIKKGNVYDYLDNDTMEWLITEASKIKNSNMAMIVAGIVKDAYHDELESINEKRNDRQDCKHQERQTSKGT